MCDYDLCCDGSDEWASVGGVKCEDKCKEIGKEWKRLDDIKQKSTAAAKKKNAELVKEAQTLRAGVEMSIGRLELEISTLGSKAADLKKKYDEVERRERGKVVKTGPGKTSKVTILASLAKNRVEELRKSLVNVVGKRNALKEKVTELEAILAQFKEEYNPNFNDEGVKRAVKAWEDYAANKDAVGESDDSAAERDMEEISKPDSETDGINWAEWETEEEDESDVEARKLPNHIADIAKSLLTFTQVYKFEEYLPESVRDWMHQKLADLRTMLTENGILASKPSTASGAESKAVTSARSAYEAADKDVSSKNTNLGNLKSDLEKDYGPSDVFRALKGTCVSKDSGEYEYELCWMEKTSQKSKKGHGNTGMGNFVRFDTMEVDEEIGADGKGLGKGERVVMRYENGQHCWNGPNRQTLVVLGCAEKDEIWKVMEQEKCMYRMDVGTPAVCEKEGKSGAVKKDEL